MILYRWINILGMLLNRDFPILTWLSNLPDYAIKSLRSASGLSIGLWNLIFGLHILCWLIKILDIIQLSWDRDIVAINGQRPSDFVMSTVLKLNVVTISCVGCRENWRGMRRGSWGDVVFGNRLDYKSNPEH